MNALRFSQGVLSFVESWQLAVSVARELRFTTPI
jgi:hypothetical protein